MDTTTPLHTTPLAAGESLHLAVDAGTVLVAVQGDLRIDEAPRWLADTLLPARHRVAEGQAHVVGQAGWLRVTALRQAQVAQVAKVAHPAPSRAGVLSPLAHAPSGGQAARVLQRQSTGLAAWMAPWAWLRATVGAVARKV